MNIKPTSLYSSFGKNYSDLFPDLQQGYKKITSTGYIIHKHNKTAFNFENKYIKPHSYNQSKIIKEKRETIKLWCIGKVIRINETDGYFEASLKDIRNNVELIAEFNIDSAFDNDDDKDLMLYTNATFIYYISQIHGYGSPEMKFKFEFEPPYIWQEDDDRRAAEKYKELFPYDPEID
ncbi:hypothetical protein MBAV_006105 [Candidatus Magnetobacterium bavaricum]|uniref:Uncharacterized protein n=1 Tax=Candidatus Magnetobacterium bavaricum TaxID=29290 RepID=A0A0F3GLX8_9BACT|nr:hypothetical protein MBAV_006105 [Candidatus Magnetobacterium bavaricum]